MTPLKILPVGILAAHLLLAQHQPAEPDNQLPPEEDAALNAPKVYGFNPVQSKREVEVGLFHMKRGNYRAAAERFIEATKWNDNNADAWLHLAEAQDKHGDPKAAREAYEHYLSVAPDAKNAGEIRKKIEHLK